MDRIRRHALADRVFHWVTALSVLVLMATAFLPIIGIKFPWVTAHWIAGLVLTLAVVFHVIRSLIWQWFRYIWFGLRDLREMIGTVTWFLGLGRQPPAKPGKYSPAQKLMHHAAALLVLMTVATGLPMMVKVDTPFWERDPYWLEAGTWGVIYVLHDLGALILLSVVMIHIYFALRPEKLMYLRAMIRGWMSREEYLAEHDPERWSGDD